MNDVMMTHCRNEKYSGVLIDRDFQNGLCIAGYSWRNICQQTNFTNDQFYYQKSAWHVSLVSKGNSQLIS